MQASRNSLDLKLLRISHHRQRNFSRDSINWCFIQKFSEKIQIFDFVSALIVFVKKQRLKKLEKFSNFRNVYQRESDFNWITNYEICFHESLICWIRNEHNSLNIEELMKKKIRCKLAWQNQSDVWRRDYVWMRKEFLNQTFFFISSKKKMINQIFCILFIHDLKFRDEKNKSLIYYNVLLNLKRSRFKRISNIINDMIELKNWRNEIARNSRNLKANKMYDISNVIRSIHVIFSEFEHYYVNNYVNWNTYIIVYDENFLKNEIRRVQNY